MATLHVLRVFTDEEGEWGNPLGVFLDGEEVPEDSRQALARRLGYSETVFVDDRRTGACRIFTPEVELPFAGHPAVGTAWLLAQAGEPPKRLRPPAGEVEVRHKGGLVSIAADAAWSPPFELRQLDAPADVDALPGPPPDAGTVYLWAWIDERAGVVRSRSFAVEAGIEEDEATGSAAIALCVQLGRPVTIHQGRGSLLHTRPLGEGRAEVGGRVVLDEVRDHPI